MLTAIDFDYQTPLKTYKIKNVVLKGHLPAKFEVRQAVIAEQLPNPRFSVGRLAAHLFSEVADNKHDQQIPAELD